MKTKFLLPLLLLLLFNVIGGGSTKRQDRQAQAYCNAGTDCQGLVYGCEA